MMKKEEIISSLVNAKICRSDEVQGASWEEVAVLEKKLRQSLPAQYREFLLGVGRGAGEFLHGTVIFASALAELRNEAIGLLNENGENVQLSEDTFVFSMHQGYEFTYFNFSEGDDPPVYQYVEGNGPPVRTWASFSDFLRDAIAQHARLKDSE